VTEMVQRFAGVCCADLPLSSDSALIKPIIATIRFSRGQWHGSAAPTNGEPRRGASRL
jgi:hypothetical protein